MPLGPGGVGDVFLRALGQELTKALGQAVIVENRPGGASLVGSQACAQSQPDGYTLCMLAIDTLSIAPFFYKSIPFDPEKDFVPVMRFFFIVEGLMVHPSLNVSTVAELIALSKAKPGTLSYATQANALTLFMEGFKKDTGADLQRVPFQSGGEATNAVLGGHVPVGYFGIGNLLPNVREGRVKLIAVDSQERTPLYPSAPTLREAGYAGIPIRPWWGLFAPAATRPSPCSTAFRGRRCGSCAIRASSNGIWSRSGSSRRSRPATNSSAFSSRIGRWPNGWCGSPASGSSDARRVGRLAPPGRHA